MLMRKRIFNAEIMRNYYAQPFLRSKGWRTQYVNNTAIICTGEVKACENTRTGLRPGAALPNTPSGGSSRAYLIGRAHGRYGAVF